VKIEQHLLLPVHDLRKTSKLMYSKFYESSIKNPKNLEEISQKFLSKFFGKWAKKWPKKQAF